MLRIILIKNPTNRFININMNIGEKSNPPADGIYFRAGAVDLYEISSISSRNEFDSEGDTQLRITPIIIAKNINLINTIKIWTAAKIAIVRIFS
tara:strand:+ start:360 stop:641 length:282 start_codon:yes stop_codon:yes gene_type:complete